MKKIKTRIINNLSYKEKILKKTFILFSSGIVLLLSSIFWMFLTIKIDLNIVGKESSLIKYALYIYSPLNIIFGILLIGLSLKIMLNKKIILNSKKIDIVFSFLILSLITSFSFPIISLFVFPESLRYKKLYDFLFLIKISGFLSSIFNLFLSLFIYFYGKKQKIFENNFFEKINNKDEIDRKNIFKKSFEMIDFIKEGKERSLYNDFYDFLRKKNIKPQKNAFISFGLLFLVISLSLVLLFPFILKNFSLPIKVFFISFIICSILLAGGTQYRLFQNFIIKRMLSEKYIHIFIPDALWLFMKEQGLYLNIKKEKNSEENNSDFISWYVENIKIKIRNKSVTATSKDIARKYDKIIAQNSFAAEVFENKIKYIKKHYWEKMDIIILENKRTEIEFYNKHKKNSFHRILSAIIVIILIDVI